MANPLSQLDAQQVIRSTVMELSSGNLAQKVAVLGGNLIPQEYDQISLTYILAGNGAGQIGTVVYKFATATVATLTLTYDASNNLIDVLRS